MKTPFILNRRGYRHPARSLLLPVAAAVALGGCGDGDPDERGEPFAMVEVDYGRAIRLSEAEVNGGELVSISLNEPESKSPVWESEIAQENGDLRIVRLDATEGKVLGSTGGTGQGARQKRELTQRLQSAELLPGEAAREAKDSTDGPVMAIELGERDGTVIWAVDILDSAAQGVVVHDVDAKTGKVLHRRES